MALILFWAVQDAPPTGARFDLALGRLFVPEHVKPEGALDLVIHFHGAAKVVEREFAKAKRPRAALVSIHVGAGSSLYVTAMKDDDALRRVIDEAQLKLPGAKLARLYLSSFSAGYGAIREILRGGRHEIEGILLADSLHAGYVDGRPDPEQMAPFVKFAASGKTMWVTHSSVKPDGYASTTETADVLIKEVGATREGDRADQGNFHVRVFGAAGPQDHLQHLRRMGDFFEKLLPAP